MRAREIFPVVLIIFFLLLLPTYGVVSESGEITVTPNSKTVNWGSNYNASFSVANGLSGYLMIDVVNATSSVLNSTGDSIPFSVYTSNSTHYVYETQTTLSSGETNTTTLIFPDSVESGRYTGSVVMKNSTNSSDNVSVTVSVDIPVSVAGSGIGSFSGNSSSSRDEYFYFNTSSVTNVAGLVVNLSSLTGNVNIYLYDDSNVLKTSRTTPGNLTYIFNSTSLDPPDAYWYVKITNSSGVGSQYSGTIELKKANLIVNNTFDSYTPDTDERIMFTRNLGSNETVSTTFYVNNTDSVALTIDEITDSSGNLTYSSGYMDFTYDISAGDIPQGSNLTQLDITLNTAKTGNRAGMYTGWMYFNTTDGYPYEDFKLSLFVDLTSDLVHSLVSVLDGVSSDIVPGEDVNLTGSVRYQNGTYINNLNESHYTVYIKHDYYSNLVSTSLRNRTLTVNDVTHSGNNYYLDATLPSNSLGGNYTMYALAEDFNTNDLNNKKSEITLMVNETALKADIHSPTYCTPGSSYNVSVGRLIYCMPKVTNYGARNANNVVISFSNGSCIQWINESGRPPLTVTLGTIYAWGGSNTTAGYSNSHLKFNASSEGTCSITVTTTASGTKWDRQNFTVTYTVSEDDSSSSGTSSTLASSGSGELSIEDYPGEINLTQGESRTYTIKIKNIGTKDLSSVGIDVEGVDISWWEKPYSRTIPDGETRSFVLKFNIPSTVIVGHYEITIKASSGAEYALATSDLIIKPSSSTILDIRRNFENYSSWYNGLVVLLKDAEDSGKNVTEAGLKLNQSKILLDEVDGLIELENYVTAFEKLVEVRSLLTSAEKIIKGEGGFFGSGFDAFLGFVGLAIIIIAVLLLLYFFLPKKGGYKPGGGYDYVPEEYRGKPRGNSFVERIKELLDELKHKVRRKKRKYSYHYSESP